MKGLSVQASEIKFIEKFHESMANFGHIFTFQNLSKVEVTLKTFPDNFLLKPFQPPYFLTNLCWGQ